MRLSEAKENIKLKIINLDNIENKDRYYLIDMGLVKDTVVKIIKKSYLKGSLIIDFRGFQLCINNFLASCINVDRI